ncbi:MAG: hypothetical protein M1821_001585 [Bathelium mastoideum]|nr:MAG: hypothetical protein M1821_001585 [Bathelium mastoideum]
MEDRPSSPSESLTEEELRALSSDPNSLFANVTTNSNDHSYVKMAVSSRLQKVLLTARLTGISPGYRATATNALCAVVEKCLASEHTYVQSSVQSADFLTSSFDVFLQWCHAGKGKSMRQLLVTIGACLRSMPNAQRETSVDQILSQSYETAFREKSSLQSKSALQALELLVSKDIVTLQHLLNSFGQWALLNINETLDIQSKERTAEYLLFASLQWLSSADKASAAAHVSIAICKKMIMMEQTNGDGRDTEGEIPVWAQPAIAVARRHPLTIPVFQNLIFPAVFKLSPSHVVTFLNLLRIKTHLGLDLCAGSCSSDSNSRIEENIEMSLLFAALLIAKEIGSIQELDAGRSFGIHTQSGSILIPEHYITKFMSDASASTRLAGLSLLISPVSVTRPFTIVTLKCLQKTLPCFHVDPDARFRGELLSLTRKLFDRLRAATFALKRNFLARSAKVLALDQLEQELQGINGDESCRLQAHLKFVRWYYKFVLDDLRPTAPYQRRICALKVILILLKSGLDSSVPLANLSKQAQGQIQWPFTMKLIDTTLVELLLNLLIDPYDDIRYSAATILASAMERPAGQPQCITADKLQTFLAQAETLMLRSGRADHADGVARTYALLTNLPNILSTPKRTESLSNLVPWSNARTAILERLSDSLKRSISAAKSDLANAVDAFPMHGLLSSLRYIVDQVSSSAFKSDDPQAPCFTMTRELQLGIVSSLEDVWHCVHDVLCSDAPEGHMPEDIEDADLDTKSILSFCWRALKEASLLLRALVDCKAPSAPGSASKEEEDLLRLGDLCFQQLVELRHRGAFSAVAQAFGACCARCSNSADPVVQGYLDIWYKRALVTIRDQASVVTRRSAGIPSLITGVLSADPTGARFANAIVDLELVARAKTTSSKINEGELVQVHALNCLKDIFRTAKLGQSSEHYVEMGFDLVSHCLNADIWAIRNCGLMLFRALIDRLLGTHESQVPDEPVISQSPRISFDKYPKLLGIILGSLNAGRILVDSRENAAFAIEQQQRTAEGMFPVLYILQRTLPPKEKVEEIQNLVLSLTASTHWVVRDMASRTFAALVAHTDATATVRCILESSSSNRNVIHGRLLATKYIVRARHHANAIDSRCKDEFYTFNKVGYSDRSEAADLFRTVNDSFPRLYQQNPCPITKAAFVDIMSLFAPFEDLAYVRMLFPDDLRQLQATRTNVLLKKSIESLVQKYQYNGWTISTQVKTREVGHYPGPNDVHDDELWPTSTSWSGTQLSPWMDLAKFRYYEDQLASVTNPSKRSELLKSLSELLVLTRGARYSISLNGMEPRLNLTFFNESVTGPLSEESVLRLYGFYLNNELTKPTTESSEKQLHIAYCRLRNALSDNKPYSTRLAVAEALLLFRHSWFSSHHPGFELKMHLLVQDLLTDDEEDLRAMGSSIVAQILVAEKDSTTESLQVPSVAKELHCNYLIRTYGHTEECGALVLYLVAKLTGGDTSVALFLSRLECPSVGSRLNQTFSRRIALFDQEDQNLYKDQTSEHADHARMIEALVPTLWNQGEIAVTLLQHMSAWVMEGLRSFTASLEHHADNSRLFVEGPLGWTYHKENFALAYSVVRVARLLLMWRVKFRKGSIKASAIKTALFEFLSAAERSNAHAHLLQSARATILEGCKLTLSTIDQRVKEILGRGLVEFGSQ